MRANAFTLPYTFFRQKPDQVFRELQAAGLTGINLALNYHSSRDFLLRQGPQLEYLSEGFHYYLPDKSRYDSNSLTPAQKDHLPDNHMLDGVLDAASKTGMRVNAWAVFLHNSALGMIEPEESVTNALGNRFLSELCPSRRRVRNYVLGLTRDLSARGISEIAIESLHFHGARHGEHHERFFMELSPMTEFLFSLCFCTACISNFAEVNGDGEALRVKVAMALQPFLTEGDPWLGVTISKSSLAHILGNEILAYLTCRESTLANLYAEVSAIAHESQVQISYIDQSTIIDSENTSPLGLSWLVGIDNEKVRRHVDAYLPLIYRKNADLVAEIATHYKSTLGGEVNAILRPTYPDNSSESSLIEKVAALYSVGVREVDFYLLDTWRPRDLQWVAAALDRIP